jgi:hypothetical protein
MWQEISTYVFEIQSYISSLFSLCGLECLRKYTSGLAILLEGECPNFQQIWKIFFSHAHENFEEQNKALESSTIIIDYCITINVCYN